jgi:hypothetical protein
MNQLSSLYLFNSISSIVMLIIPLLMLFMLAASAFWVWMIIDVAERPLQDKTKWLIIVIFLHFIGAAIYYFTGRKGPLVPQSVGQNAYVPTPPVLASAPQGIPQTQNIPIPPVSASGIQANAIPYSGMAITSLVFAVLSLLLCFIPGFNLIFPILALVFGILAHKNIKKGLSRGNGMAITGICIGCVALLVGLVMTAFSVLVAHFFYTDSLKTATSIPSNNQSI